MSDAIAIRDLRRSFVQAETKIEVLRGINLSVARGEIVALLGPSGSGKSTMLQAVGLLEGGFSGSIEIDGEEVARLNDEGRTRVRRDKLGFVYQFHHLLPDFSALENVEPCWNRLVLVRVWITNRHSFRAVNSNAWPLRGPLRMSHC
jgi:lipoprotein-releasing system ATP-binding protein